MAASLDPTLPPVLDASSHFWFIKKKAASQLKRGNHQESIRLYEKCFVLLDVLINDKKLRAHPLAQKWMRELNHEQAKLKANVFMIYLKDKNVNMALECATQSATYYPDWAKAHARRGQALESFNSYDECVRAYALAIETCSDQKENKQYQKMLDNVQTLLNHQNEASPPEELTRPREPESAPDIVCSDNFNILITNNGLLLHIIQWLDPASVAKLQLTHRFFLYKPETYWRTSRCGRLLSSSVFEGAIQEYCASNHDSPELAMDLLVTSLTKLAPDSTDWLSIANQALRTLERIAFWSSRARLGSRYIHTAMLDSPDICASLCLICEGNVDLSLRCKATASLNELVCRDEILDDHMNPNMISCFKFGLHDMLFRLLISDIRGDDSTNGKLTNFLRNNTFKVLFNLHLLADKLCASITSPTGELTSWVGDFTTAFNANVPQLWPCQGPGTDDWEHDAWTIDRYWQNQPPHEFQRWKYAIDACLDSAQRAESFGYKPAMTLQYFPMKGDDRQMPVYLVMFSFGLFLVKAGLKHDGVGRLRSTLTCRLDCAKLLSEYYSMLALYAEALPIFMDLRDQTVLAQRRGFAG